MNVKTLVSAVALASTLDAPAVSFAQQSNVLVTRAQVRAELVELEKAGYHVGEGDQTTYPAEIQAAEARAAAQKWRVKWLRWCHKWFVESRPRSRVRDRSERDVQPPLINGFVRLGRILATAKVRRAALACPAWRLIPWP